VRVHSWSTLDLYGLYRHHKHSFNISDDALPDLMTVGSDMGRKVRVSAIQKWRSHAVRSWERSSIVEVIPRYDHEIPIWVPERTLGEAVEFFVEGYNQPLWIRSSREPRSRYGDLAESIAYWLWQCTDGLAPLLEPMGSEPIVFTLGESDSFFSTT